MLEHGTGRRAWRAKYPTEEWTTSKRQQLENGDRIVMLGHKHSDRFAVLTFYDDKNGDLNWVIHCDGGGALPQRMYDLLVQEAERHPAMADYSHLPHWGRF